MPDFTRYSNYNENTSASSVVYGKDAPLLEVEANEMQDIINTKLKRVFESFGKCIIPDSTTNGSLVISYTSDADHSAGVTLTIINCILLAKGMTAFIPSATISFNSGAYQYVYARVTTATARGNTTLRAYGNTDGATVPNPIIDDRIMTETSRRKITTYTIMSGSSIPSDTDAITYVPIAIPMGNSADLISCALSFSSIGLKESIASEWTSAGVDAFQMTWRHNVLFAPTEEWSMQHSGEKLTTDPITDLVNWERVDVATMISAIGRRLADISIVTNITLDKNNWMGSARPFTYAYTLQGVTADDVYEIIGFAPTNSSATNASIKGQLGRITYGQTSANTLTFVACTKKPDIDLPIVIRKVV